MDDITKAIWQLERAFHDVETQLADPELHDSDVIETELLIQLVHLERRLSCIAQSAPVFATD
ncbi:MAG TPA: hypothetical protein VM165_20080 [Planctomycetaceae bacterium]|nr:hypothetical protein [Planctomycetaceae bacterium]